jgi:hypothetical protein
MLWDSGENAHGNFSILEVRQAMVWLAVERRKSARLCKRHLIATTIPGQSRLRAMKRSACFFRFSQLIQNLVWQLYQ